MEMTYINMQTWPMRQSNIKDAPSNVKYVFILFQLQKPHWIEIPPNLEVAFDNTFAAAVDAAGAASTASVVATNLSRSNEDELDKPISISYNAFAAPSAWEAAVAHAVALVTIVFAISPAEADAASCFRASNFLCLALSFATRTMFTNQAQTQRDKAHTFKLIHENDWQLQITNQKRTGLNGKDHKSSDFIYHTFAMQ